MKQQQQKQKTKPGLLENVNNTIVTWTLITANLLLIVFTPRSSENCYLPRELIGHKIVIWIWKIIKQE